MNQFSFPTTILHGEGALKELSNRIPWKKLMLVTDAGLTRTGVVDQALAILNIKGCEFGTCSNIWIATVCCETTYLKGCGFGMRSKLQISMLKLAQMM